MLYLVRHAQTEANAAGLIQGQSDFELTDLGHRQARALAGALPVAAEVIASPLGRARRTAAAIAGERPVTTDARWVEMDFGELDGRPIDDVRHLLWTNWARDLSWAPPGGESLASVQARVTEACEELAPRFADGHVVVVTHVSPIKSAVAWALGADPLVAHRMFVEQASVATVLISRDNGLPVLRSFNELPWTAAEGAVTPTAPRGPGTGGRGGSAG